MAVSFIGGEPGRSDLPLMVVDLGYSARRPSCGLMHEGLSRPESLMFGECISAVRRRIEETGDGILVLEGVLSTYHDDRGNPDIRGSFEKRMGWYYGPGAVTLAAARQFLGELQKRAQVEATIYLVEAFLSFKHRHRSHCEDALTIFRHFREAPVQDLRPGCVPILPDVHGVPPVRSFVRWLGGE